MLIREALAACWRACRDTWNELGPLVLANVAWFLACAAPLLLPQAWPTPGTFVLAVAISLAGLALLTPALAYVAHRVARGGSFDLGDLWDGLRRYAGVGARWLLANLAADGLIAVNLVFYPRTFEGRWVAFVWAFWLAVAALWMAMQIYLWPLLMEQERPALLRGWRNAALLVFANPVYAAVVLLLTLLLSALSTVLVMPLILFGVALVALLAQHATLTLLAHYALIPDYRPAPAQDESERG